MIETYRGEIRPYSEDYIGQRIGWAAIGYNEDSFKLSADIAMATIDSDLDTGETGFQDVRSVRISIDDGFNDPVVERRHVLGHDYEETIKRSVLNGRLFHTNQQNLLWSDNETSLVDVVHDRLVELDKEPLYSILYYELNAAAVRKIQPNCKTDVDAQSRRLSLLYPDEIMNTVTTNLLANAARVIDSFKRIERIDKQLIKDLTVFGDTSSQGIVEAFIVSRRGVIDRYMKLQDYTHPLFHDLLSSTNSQNYPDYETLDDPEAYSAQIAALRSRDIGPAYDGLRAEQERFQRRLCHAAIAQTFLADLSIAETT